MLAHAATATPLAATHSHTLPGAAWLPLIILAVTAGYLLWCWASPYTHCRRCAGYGKRKPRTGRRPRHCRWCDGTGMRLRPGRHIVNHLRTLHRDGSR